MFAAELRFIGKYREYWSEGYKGYVSDQRTLWWQADMMNGVIVIKEHRKQYKSVEKQGLVSLVSLLMEQTLTLTKLYFFFVSLLFPSLYCPFQLRIFSCCFHCGYEKASSTSRKTIEDLLKKTLNYQSQLNIRNVMSMFWLHLLIEGGNYVQFCHAPPHCLSTFINICPNFLKKRCPLRIQQPF